MSNELTPEDKELIKILEKKVDRLYKAMFPDEQPDNEVEEQPKEVEQKERWLPAYGCKYWYIGIYDGHNFISDFNWG